MTRDVRDTGKGGSGDIFLDRMEAQIGQIQRYRRNVLRGEGRLLSPEEAALEWIERYAAAFARDNDNI